MKMHKTILTLLAAMLAVIGTTATVVHADESETTPAPDPNINSYLNQASEDLVNEMNSTFQDFVAEAWEFVKVTAPAEDWEEAIRDIIPQIYADADGQNGLASYTGALTNSCSFTKYTTLGSSGWAAAVSSSTCTMGFMRAAVTVNTSGDTNTCFNCRSAWAYINGLSCGWYFASGDHEWGNNPSGGGSSSDSGQAGC